MKPGTSGISPVEVLLGRAVMAGLGLLLLWRLWAVWQGYPYSWIDEIYYSGPAVSYVRDGTMANPGLSDQFVARGAASSRETCHLLFWLGSWVRLPFMLPFAADRFEGRLLAETVIFFGAVAAFMFVARRLARPGAAWVMVAAFVSIPSVFCEGPGRNDVLSLALGLAALGVLMARDRPDARVVHGLLSGLLFAAAFLAHSFGGLFWAATAGLWLLFHRRWRLLAGVFCGGVAGMSLWLLTILSEFPLWWDHYRAMMDLKFGLPRDPGISLYGLLSLTFFSNRLWWVVLPIMGLAAAFGKGRRFLAAAVLVLGAFALWKCFRFEYFIASYGIHFRALLLLTALAGYPVLESWITGTPWLRNFARPLVVVALVLVFLGMGWLPCRATLVEPLMADLRGHWGEVAHVLKREIPSDARALVDCRLYFLSGNTAGSAMMVHERMSLEDYDYVVLASAEVPTAESMPQWGDRLTVDQATDLARDFRLVASVPEVRRPYPRFLFIRKPHFEIPGCYIYRKMSRE